MGKQVAWLKLAPVRQPATFIAPPLVGGTTVVPTVIDWSSEPWRTSGVVTPLFMATHLAIELGAMPFGSLARAAPSCSSTAMPVPGPAMIVWCQQACGAVTPMVVCQNASVPDPAAERTDRRCRLR